MEGIGYLIRMILEAWLSLAVIVILSVLFIGATVFGFGLLSIIAVGGFVWVILYGLYHIAKGQVLKWRKNWFF